jgi:DNA primase catalytic subunit
MSLTKMNFNYIIVLQVIHRGGLIMTTISLRVNDDESKLIHDYVSVNQLNMSQFIRDAVLDKIENDLDLDEDRILYAFEKAKQEKTYDHTEIWKMLGV